MARTTFPKFKEAKDFILIYSTKILFFHYNSKNLFEKLSHFYKS